MEIKAIDVKKLREETNAGMMDCKKALLESEGDFDKAKLLLREKGQSKADKKSGRTTAQGLVKVESSNDHISITKISKLILDDSIDTIEQLNQQAIDEFASVEDYRKYVVSKIGENITVRRFERIPVNGIAGSYIHGSKIASVAIINSGDEQLAKDIAMHVAASHPEYIQMSDIPEDVVNEEKKILTKQVEDEGKPAEIVPKIVDGKLNKQFNSVTLMGQEFIKDPDLTVGKLLESHSSSVVAFVRYEVGEGVEVEEVNFADEVKAQVDSVN